MEDKIRNMNSGSCLEVLVIIESQVLPWMANVVNSLLLSKGGLSPNHWPALNFKSPVLWDGN